MYPKEKLSFFVTGGDPPPHRRKKKTGAPCWGRKSSSKVPCFYGAPEDGSQKESNSWLARKRLPGRKVRFVPKVEMKGKTLFFLKKTGSGGWRLKGHRRAGKTNHGRKGESTSFTKIAALGPSEAEKKKKKKVLRRVRARSAGEGMGPKRSKTRRFAALKEKGPPRVARQGEAEKEKTDMLGGESAVLGGSRARIQNDPNFCQREITGRRGKTPGWSRKGFLPFARKKGVFHLKKSGGELAKRARNP